jgi:hypothetical protein
MTARGEFHYSSTPTQEATGYDLARRPIAYRNHRPRPTQCGTPQTVYTSTLRHVLSPLSGHAQPHSIGPTAPCMCVCVPTLLSRGGVVPCTRVSNPKPKTAATPRVSNCWHQPTFLHSDGRHHPSMRPGVPIVSFKHHRQHGTPIHALELLALPRAVSCQFPCTTFRHGRLLQNTPLGFTLLLCHPLQHNVPRLISSGTLLLSHSYFCFFA